MQHWMNSLASLPVIDSVDPAVVPQVLGLFPDRTDRTDHTDRTDRAIAPGHVAFQPSQANRSD